MTEAPQTSATVPQWTTGDRMRKAREHAGLKQSELAAEIGIGRTSVTHYETSQKDAPRLVLIAWAFRCGVSFEWLRHGGPTGPNPGPGTSAQLRDAESMCRRILTPSAQWGSPTPLTLAVAA